MPLLDYGLYPLAICDPTVRYRVTDPAGNQGALGDIVWVRSFFKRCRRARQLFGLKGALETLTMIVRMLNENAITLDTDPTSWP
jgi:hypothetical protein